jgi:hypothetical protein
VPLTETAARIRFALVALAVSALPEHVKREGRYAEFASPAAHIVSGWVETVVSASLFVVGLLAYLTGFSHGTGWTYLSSLPTSTIWDWRGVGVIGYLSYLLTPVAWVTLFCFVEGIARALDAALSQRMLGMAFVALPWRAFAAGHRTGRRLELERLLGPERPDEVVVWADGGPVALTIYASREKPWIEHQVIEFRNEALRAVGKTLLRRGDHHAFRYDFRHLEPGEVIRGVLVRYDPDASPTGPPPEPKATSRPS